jgi:hypothetical protein
MVQSCVRVVRQTHRFREYSIVDNSAEAILTFAKHLTRYSGVCSNVRASSRQEWSGLGMDGMMHLRQISVVGVYTNVDNHVEHMMTFPSRDFCRDTQFQEPPS